MAKYSTLLNAFHTLFLHSCFALFISSNWPLCLYKSLRYSSVQMNSAPSSSIMSVFIFEDNEKTKKLMLQEYHKKHYLSTISGRLETLICNAVVTYEPNKKQKTVLNIMTKLLRSTRWASTYFVWHAGDFIYLCIDGSYDSGSIYCRFF